MGIFRNIKSKQTRRLNVSWHAKISLTLVMIVMVFTVVTSFAFAGSSQITNITIDGNKAGALFNGIGAISGGSGSSRLLIDYPQPQRSQILKYLFKPNYGANIQLLKIEIGGDSGTTDGAEPSIEHSPGQINCNSGYEWWIAEQAVALNSNIKLFALQWSAPGWTGEGKNTIWTKNNIKYVLSWMKCAKSHGLNISYIGGWDEEGYNASWYESLRIALDSNGYAKTKIVASDDVSNPWGIAESLSKNTKFKNDVGVIGVHDTCPANPTSGYSCYSSENAKKLGLPLWESELGGMSANYGAASMVRSIINGYSQAKLTGYIEWPLIDSMPSGLPFDKRGLITADQPWSGYYKVNLMTWAIAQTTQFTKPGWVYIEESSNSIGDSGAYNAYESLHHSYWTMEAENTGTYKGQPVRPQVINVKLDNLPARVIHVWETSLWDHNPKQWFMHRKNIYPKNGQFTYTIQPGMVVSFTTTNRQSKGITIPPESKALSLPYTNMLSTNDGSDEPPLLSAQDGAFELASCRGGINGLCTEQMTNQPPVHWNNTNGKSSYPYAIIGDNWANYMVTVNMLFQQTNGSGGVIGRFSKRSGDIGNYDGYLLNIYENGKWEILKNKNSNLPSQPIVLASGSVPNLGLNKWHSIGLSMKGDNLSAVIDGKIVGRVVDLSYSSGLAGIEADAFTNNWSNNQYSDLSILPISSGHY